MIKHIHALFLICIFCICCAEESKPIVKAEKIKSDTSHLPNLTGVDTKYEYVDSLGKMLTILNGYPRGQVYKTSDGKEYVKATFWTQVTNQTDNRLELQIEFPAAPYEVPASVGASISNRYKLILLPVSDQEKLNDAKYIDSLVVNSVDNPSSLKKTIHPGESNHFTILRLLQKPENGFGSPKPSGTGTTRAGLRIEGEKLIYKLNGEDIPCGQVNIKNLKLKS